MKAIKQYDEIIKAFESGEKKFDRNEVDNFDLFDAYYKSVWKAKNDEVDFSGIIWEDRVEALVDAMFKHGIRYFTISSGQSRVQDVIAAMMDCRDGMELVGMKLVNTGTKNPFGGGDIYEPAFLLHIIDLSDYAE